jgi:hypothetical protein
MRIRSFVDYCSVYTFLFDGDLRARCVFVTHQLMPQSRVRNIRCLEGAFLAKEQGAILVECAVLSSKNIMLHFSSKRARRVLCSGIIHGVLIFGGRSSAGFYFSDSSH